MEEEERGRRNENCRELLATVKIRMKSDNAVQCSAVQCSTVQHSTVQYSTVQYSTVQYSTVQYSTVQYSTVQYSTVTYLMQDVHQMSLRHQYPLYTVAWNAT